MSTCGWGVKPASCLSGYRACWCCLHGVSAQLLSGWQYLLVACHLLLKCLQWLEPLLLRTLHILVLQGLQLCAYSIQGGCVCLAAAVCQPVLLGLLGDGMQKGCSHAIACD